MKRSCSLHESAPVDLFCRTLVVGAAEQADSARIVQVREREPVHVFELQVAGLRAPAPALVDEGAASAHDPTHLLLTRRGCDRNWPCAHVEMLRWSTCRKRWVARVSATRG